MRALLVFFWRLWGREVRAFWRRQPLRQRTVLYESFAGNGALCNPEAIFRQLMLAPDLADLRHVWVLKNLKQYREFQREFNDHQRVRFVRYRSARYFHALATSKYLVNNATFPPEFSKRDGQVYLNTWHGTPLKRMGYDMPNGAAESSNTLRNFLSADFLISQNPFMTDEVYDRAYKLRGIFRGRVIEEGLPRVDRQFLEPHELARVRARLTASGIPVGDREIVLYAPTWKGQSFSSPKDDAIHLIAATRQLQALLGDEKYIVLLKSHQIVHSLLARVPEYSAELVPNEIATNEILGVTRILITDYSSIFFDFLASDRPIIFYTPDASDYAATRGTYFAEGELPGRVFTDLEDVAKEVIRAGAPRAARHRRYTQWRKRFASHDDGGAAERVVDVVFRGFMDARNTVSLAESPRVPIALHLGSMNSNGITSSALNLLAAIDHDRYDVTAIMNRPRSPQQWQNQARIDARVRQLHRAGVMDGGILHQLYRRASEWFALPDVHHRAPAQNQMWNDEWRRCFGDARFDRLIDFDGYGPFWATLLLHGKARCRAIWQHNDVVAETGRVIRGRRRIKRSLRAVFARYHEYDALVSVSPPLARVNRASFETRYRVAAGAFRSARNLVDAAHVIEGLSVPLADLPEHLPEHGGDAAPAWLTELEAHDGTTWFVTLGRFSTEKNQYRMVRAFAAVHSQHPETRLLLIGYGPLRDELRRLIHTLGLDTVATVAGPYANPFPLLAAADCFVLSSDHEGQPMVILEAAIVGMPIVSVRFGSIEGAIPGSVIHIVERSDEALAEGMLAQLRGEVPVQRLDVESYNRAALAEFVAAVEPR